MSGGAVLQFKKNRGASELERKTFLMNALASASSSNPDATKSGNSETKDTEVPSKLGPVTSGTICMPKKSSLFNRPVAESKKKLEERISLQKKSVAELPELYAQSVSISTLSTQEIMKLAVVEVNKPLFTGPGSVNAPEMGVTEVGQTCPTCMRDVLTCTGHYGYIKLNQHIINPLAIRDLIRVLKAVCNEDGRLLIPKEVLESKGILSLTGFRRLEAIETLIDGGGYVCMPKDGCDGHCKSNPQFDVTRSQEKNMICYTEGKKKSKEGANLYEFSIKDIEIILSGITDETYKLLGFTNGATAKNFIWEVIPVAPNTTRLPTDQDGTIWHADLTRSYLNIVKVNNQLESKELKEEDRTRLVGQLVELIKNMILKSNKKGKKDESITSKLQGKDALPRAHMMGKRVNYSGRTVISPDPSLKFGQVRVPFKIARTITKPVTIQFYNRDLFQRMLESGRGISHLIPGENSSYPKKWRGQEIAVTEQMMNTYKLRIGDVVRRWLMNGDIVIINRQPTLSKKSFMAMEAVIVGVQYVAVHMDKKVCTSKGCSEVHRYRVINEGPKTFGLNMSYTSPFNADFDGDEMNIHVPQDPQSEAEVRELMSVRACIMGDQTNQNDMGVVYNAVTAASELTGDDIYVNSDVLYDSMYLLTSDFNMEEWEKRLQRYDVPMLSGKAFFSMLLPPDFFYSKAGVVINHGVLIKGRINKDHIGPSSGSIVQAIWHQYGPDRTSEFITDAYYILDKWLNTKGLSISYADCNPTSPEIKELVQREIAKAKLMVASLGTGITDPIEAARREREIENIVNNVERIGSKLLTKHLTGQNSLAKMVNAKTKGKASNFAQLAGLIGQQFIGGRRLEYGLAYLNDPDDPDIALESRGFISSSFSQGMTPAEMVQHQAAGREGLINTGLTTAESGSAHHMLAKSTEDISSRLDGSVRNTYGVILSFMYGGDGLDPSRLMKVKVRGTTMLSFINMQDEATRLNAKYGY